MLDEDKVRGDDEKPSSPSSLLVYELEGRQASNCCSVWHRSEASTHSEIKADQVCFADSHEAIDGKNESGVDLLAKVRGLVAFLVVTYSSSAIIFLV